MTTPKFTPGKSISAQEIKSLTKQPTLPRAIAVLAKRLEARHWKHGERSFSFSGINWDKDYVLFCAIWSVEGGAAYQYLKASIADTCDCLTGNLETIDTVLN